MLGIRFIKSQPTTYLMQFSGGKVVREGAGQSFFYYAPTSSIVAVPIGSKDQGFIFEQVTADFQSVTVQGQISYRVGEPGKLASMLNYALRPDGRGYESDDPEKLAPRVMSVVEVLSKQVVKDLALKDALRASDRIAGAVMMALRQHPEIDSLGLEVLGVAIHAIKPTPETSRTLAEAEAHRLVAVMKALENADPRIVQALAAAGMQPNQLIAQAFGGIAEKAEKIGQLNVSPELLQAL